MLAKHILLVAATSAGLYAQSEATAQTSSDAPTQRPCTYETCALRLDPGFFGTRLVRGMPGERVPLGAWSQHAVPLFSQSDSAASHAARYVRATRQEAGLGLLATMFVTTAFVRSRMGHNDDGNAILALTGSGLILITLPVEIRAQKHLSRAIWWYNSTLRR